jgi:hypothetical protein
MIPVDFCYITIEISYIFYIFALTINRNSNVIRAEWHEADDFTEI